MNCLAHKLTHASLHFHMLVARDIWPEKVNLPIFDECHLSCLNYLLAIFAPIIIVGVVVIKRYRYESTVANVDAIHL